MVSVSGNRYVGGLVGYNKNVIVHCYSTGEVSGGSYTGGLVGKNLNLVVDSFWDMETSGRSSSAGGTGKTTAEMQTAGTFIDWGCDPAWNLDEHNGYPGLLWENKPGQIITTKGKFGGGCGTYNDPYIIYTPEQLNSIGAKRESWNKHFKVTADIDLREYTDGAFNIIGYYNDIVDDKPFRGGFDGNGHKISNFNYTCTGLNHVGLFGYVNGSGARILNLGLSAPNVDAGTGYYVGSLVGWLKGGIISGCYAKGGSVSGGYDIGGLVGRKGASMNNCYASVNTSGIGSVGGLVGVNYGVVSNCYSTGRVWADGVAGGLVGSDLNLGSTTNSFWDIETSEQPGSDGGSGKTTPEMQTESTFTSAGWDFVGTWDICDGTNYPNLAWQIPLPGDLVCPNGIEMFDFSFFAARWLDDNCGASNDCNGRDLDLLGSVDIKDLRIFVDNWLRGF